MLCNQLLHVGCRCCKIVYIHIQHSNTTLLAALLTIGAQSYGVFLGYYLENGIYPAATPTDFAFIGGLNFSVAMLASPAVTVLVRRNPFGIHLPMLIGVGLQTAGFITASFATRIWHLYLTQGVLVGLGVGFTYIPSIAVLSQWFRRRRSLANGISAAGSGIGGLMFSFLVRATINNVSLAWSLRITGLVSGFMNILATVAIKSRNHIIQPKQHPFNVDLLCRYDVMLVLAWAFVSMLGYITLLFSMSNFASSIGLGESQSVNVTAFLNLGTALGRPFIGIISDYFGRIQTAGFITLLCALSVFAIWIPATSYGVTILFVIINGAILGVFWVVSHLLARRSCLRLTSHGDNWANMHRSRRTWRTTIYALAGLVSDRVTNRL